MFAKIYFLYIFAKQTKHQLIYIQLIMFKRECYIKRREALRGLVRDGLILIFGNNESSYNYPSNVYKYRQDSTFLYFFGQKRDGLVGIIDVDNNKEYLAGNDIDIDDIIWLGATPSVSDLASEVGVENAININAMNQLVTKAKAEGRRIHFLPQYRHDIMIQISDLLGIHPLQTRAEASVELIKAVVALRSKKEEVEIEELEKAAAIGYKMHTTAMQLCRPGVTEQYIAGVIDGIASSYGSMVSFPTIMTMHGEIMHGIPTSAQLEEGRLMLCDAGAENNMNYCSDNTRTTPVSGRFTQQQRAIYDTVVACHDLAVDLARPGVTWKSVHLDICRRLAEGLKDVGLMKGDLDEAVALGAHALFLPHGLGHMMGLDVHDMEGLGQQYVGFDDEVQPSTQFGLNCLRMGRKLEKGFVLTDEPGCYFIPALIDQWKAEKKFTDFINYDEVEKYRDFGGIRVENDLLITSEGCRIIGQDIIPYHADEVESFINE